MPDPKRPIAVAAATVPPRARSSNYPAPFAARVAGREKRALGDHFGLKNFGVNLTRIAPGGLSALRHAHSAQDEFIYVVEGEAVLVTDAGETLLTPGMCAGFTAGVGDAHHLVNRSPHDFLYLEVGDRSAGDEVTYPDDDLVGTLDSAGARCFARKSGEPY